jgi:ABC-2 type transport system permease protein
MIERAAVIFTREWAGYFHSPLAYVFLAAFSFTASGLYWQFGGFFDARLADLTGFFSFLPWLFVVFLPALAMRLWAEERHGGMDEILLTLPLPVAALVAGKFLAALGVASMGLVLTMPLWIVITVLGEPDHGGVIAGYLASFLLAAFYLGVSFAISTLTRSQVVAFVVSVFACFALTLSGANILGRSLSGIAPEGVIAALSWASPIARFETMQRGFYSLADLFWFLGAILLTLVMARTAIAAQKAQA